MLHTERKIQSEDEGITCRRWTDFVDYNLKVPRNNLHEVVCRDGKCTSDLDVMCYSNRDEWSAKAGRRREKAKEEVGGEKEVKQDVEGEVEGKAEWNMHRFYADE